MESGAAKTGLDKTGLDLTQLAPLEAAQSKPLSVEGRKQMAHDVRAARDRTAALCCPSPHCGALLPPSALCYHHCTHALPDVRPMALSSPACCP